jgi:hypothetical protein
MTFAIPGLQKLNPGLKLANTFGVTSIGWIPRTHIIIIRVSKLISNIYHRSSDNDEGLDSET